MSRETPSPDQRADVAEVAELCAGVLEALPPAGTAADRDVRERMEAFVRGVRAVVPG